jgi:hypothetical protein
VVRSITKETTQIRWGFESSEANLGLTKHSLADVLSHDSQITFKIHETLPISRRGILKSLPQTFKSTKLSLFLDVAHSSAFVPLVRAHRWLANLRRA